VHSIQSESEEKARDVDELNYRSMLVVVWQAHLAVVCLLQLIWESYCCWWLGRSACWQRRSSHQRSYSTLNPVSNGIGDRFFLGGGAGYHLGM